MAVVNREDNTEVLLRWGNQVKGGVIIKRFYRELSFITLRTYRELRQQNCSRSSQQKLLPNVSI